MKRTPDMTSKQFHAALRRRGWRCVLLWVSGTGKDGHMHGVGLVMRRNARGKYKLNYRASLAAAARTLVSREDV